MVHTDRLGNMLYVVGILRVEAHNGTRKLQCHQTQANIEKTVWFQTRVCGSLHTKLMVLIPLSACSLKSILQVVLELWPLHSDFCLHGEGRGLRRSQPPCNFDRQEQSPPTFAAFILCPSKNECGHSKYSYCPSPPPTQAKIFSMYRHYTYLF